MIFEKFGVKCACPSVKNHHDRHFQKCRALMCFVYQKISQWSFTKKSQAPPAVPGYIFYLFFRDTSFGHIVLQHEGFFSIPPVSGLCFQPAEEDYSRRSRKEERDSKKAAMKRGHTPIVAFKSSSSQTTLLDRNIIYNIHFHSKIPG